MTDQYVDVHDYTRARFLQREAERNDADRASRVVSSARVQTAADRGHLREAQRAHVAAVLFRKFGRST